MSLTKFHPLLMRVIALCMSDAGMPRSANDRVRNRRMMTNILTAEALAGKDGFCMNYLKAFRGGSLSG